MFGLENGNRCCRCCRCCSDIQTICYCSRFADVPMTTVYGEGYTEIDCCIDTRQTLEGIADSLKQIARATTGCGCNCGC